MSSYSNFFENFGRNCCRGSIWNSPTNTCENFKYLQRSRIPSKVHAGFFFRNSRTNSIDTPDIYTEVITCIPFCNLHDFSSGISHSFSFFFSGILFEISLGFFLEMHPSIPPGFFWDFPSNFSGNCSGDTKGSFLDVTVGIFQKLFRKFQQKRSVRYCSFFFCLPESKSSKNV